MPRPKTKAELLAQSNESFRNLFAYIDTFTDEEQHQEFRPGTMNRNIRDVLAHLYHWQLLFLDWYEKGMAGEKPKMPAKGHTWKTVPDLNRQIRLRYKRTPLDKVRAMLSDTHEKLDHIIREHTNEELFTKKLYAWTGSTSLGAYLVSATVSHYEWALKLIRKGMIR